MKSRISLLPYHRNTALEVEILRGETWLYLFGLMCCTTVYIFFYNDFQHKLYESNRDLITDSLQKENKENKDDYLSNKKQQVNDSPLFILLSILF